MKLSISLILLCVSPSVIALEAEATQRVEIIGLRPGAEDLFESRHSAGTLAAIASASVAPAQSTP
jgi:hypothetical protein